MYRAFQIFSLDFWLNRGGVLYRPQGPWGPLKIIFIFDVMLNIHNGKMKCMSLIWLNYAPVQEGFFLFWNNSMEYINFKNGIFQEKHKTRKFSTVLECGIFRNILKIYQCENIFFMNLYIFTPSPPFFSTFPPQISVRIFTGNM